VFFADQLFRGGSNGTSKEEGTSQEEDGQEEGTSQEESSQEEDG
jgi:hypothetical protein